MIKEPEDHDSEASPEPVQPNPAPGNDPPADTIASERDKLAAEKAELLDRHLRSQAEFQNFRRRVEKEKIELLEYSSAEVVRALLPVLDDFERALGVPCADKEYAKGMELIYQRLGDQLKKLGLEPISAMGLPF